MQALKYWNLVFIVKLLFITVTAPKDRLHFPYDQIIWCKLNMPEPVNTCSKIVKREKII